MKKIFYTLSAIALLVSCQNDLKENIQTTSIQPNVVFEGGFVQTKTAFTSAETPSTNLVWSQNDEIGIFTIQGNTANINSKASLINTSVGALNGIFIPEMIASDESVEPVSSVIMPESGSDKFLIYYPYSTKVDINVDDFKIHHSIAEVQIQDNVNDKQIGKNGFAYAISTVTAEAKKVNFALNHATPYVRFVVSSSEFSSYMLQSVQLMDKSEQVAIAGGFTFDCANYAVATKTGTELYSAKVRVADNAEFKAIGSGTQELYLTTLPCDLSSSDLYAIVTFVNNKKETVSIPVSIAKKGKLEAGTMTTVELSNVSVNSNAFSWYEPIEKRNLVDGWCYGAQNTYFIERSTTEGQWNKLDIEVKARGDLSKVAEPKYVGIISSGDIGNNGLVRLSDNTKAYSATPATQVVDNTISVIMAPRNVNCGNSAWGVVAIYDKDYNLLWSFMINSYENGDEIKAIEYPGLGESVMDRPLGAKLSATIANFNASSGRGCYFQWGRPTPLMWSNSGQTHYNGALVTEDTDLAAAIAKPFIKYGYAKGEGWDSKGNWYVGEDKDLWGCEDQSIDMGKTIYDPCPAGYRVASRKVIESVISKGVRNECDHTDITLAEDVLMSSNSTLVYPLGNDQYDYWFYLGAHWGSNGSWGNRSSFNNKSGALYWSNSPIGAQGFVLQHCYFSSGYSGADSNPAVNKANKAQAMAVRCMVDKDNR